MHSAKNITIVALCHRVNANLANKLLAAVFVMKRVRLGFEQVGLSPGCTDAKKKKNKKKQKAVFRKSSKQVKGVVRDTSNFGVGL